MSINFTQIKNRLYNIPDLKYITEPMRRYNTVSYRSRIPFFTDIESSEISWLISACCVPLEQWHTFGTVGVRDNYALYIRGVCTDRSTPATLSYIESILDGISYNAYGIQMGFVNVTNKAQYPVVLEYLNSDNVWSIVQRTTTRCGDKPVEFVTARAIIDLGSGYSTTRYVCFTTLWDYDLNKSLLYGMLNHMLTTPFEGNLLSRTTANRAAYTWFTKYFEGQDVTPFITEYLDRELVSKAAEILKTKLKTKLDAFGKLKAKTRNNIDSCILDEYNKIHDYERYIAQCYENIRQQTLRKLKQESSSATLDILNTIFEGMLNKQVLTGFDYRTSDGCVSRVAWRVRLPITYWEEDEAKYWLRELAGNEYSQALFKAMFIDKLIVPYCEQTITMNLENGRIGNDGLDIDDTSRIYPHHPHVGLYNCFGNNAADASRAITSQDLITAVTICMNAVMQLNMTDHTVTSRFMRMCRPDNDYRNLSFLLYRGKMCTPIELYNIYQSEGGFSNGETN